MKKILFILNSLTGSLFCAAQQEGRMETDRPDQTESPYTVKKNWFQAEFGFNIEKENKLKTFVHPTVLWKYGVSEKFELRLITEFISTETPLIIPYGNDVITGLLPIQVGGKVALWEEKKLLPKTSLIFHIAPAKLGSKKFHTSKWAPDFVFTFQHSLSENVGLGYNLGAAWDGEDNTPYWVYTLAPGFNIGKKWYTYIEVFGLFRKNKSPQNNLDAGIAYFINNDVKIDFSSGFGISKASPDNYFALGVSFRFNTAKRK